jgi:transaldolase
MAYNYLQWLAAQTPTVWWHDSADPHELTQGLSDGATGVTTNPVLTARALHTQPSYWADKIGVLGADLAPRERAQRLTQGVVTETAARLVPQFRGIGGRTGYVCAQVDPGLAGDRETMMAMAQRFHAWAPNIAVKLPVTAAGLDVLEDCVAQGITITATVSFTVPQVLAVGERHRRGAERARQAGITPGDCFAVIMIGRLDDYIRDVAWDSRAAVSEEDIQQAGLAVSKRAYRIYQERGYHAVLLVAALRGTHHMTEMAGAKLIMSLHPSYQRPLVQPGVPQEERINRVVAAETIARLCTIPEFVRAYEPDGMAADEFIAYGVTQRTLSQFKEVGWSQLEQFKAF